MCFCCNWSLLILIEQERVRREECCCRCTLVLQFAFFQMVFWVLCYFPRVIFDCLYLIPCFRRMFLTSVWLMLSTRLISLEIKPAITRNDHVENGSPQSFLGFLVTISTILFSMSSDILIGLCLCIFDAIPSMPFSLNDVSIF